MKKKIDISKPAPRPKGHPDVDFGDATEELDKEWLAQKNKKPKTLEERRKEMGL